MGFFSGLINDFKNRNDSFVFVQKYPNSSQTSRMNFMDIVRAGKEIEKYHGFEEFDPPYSKFSKAEKTVYTAYESRFNSGNQPDLYHWIREVERQYGKRF